MSELDGKYYAEACYEVSHKCATVTSNLAREAGFTITECRELKRDNNKWPTLARYMVMLRPRLAKCLHFRESGIERDGIDLIAEWHAIVNPMTFFYADDWKDATAKCMSGDATAL